MFGEKLKILRKEHRLTQKQLADLIGVDRTSIGKYETANVVPGAEVLSAITQVFDCTIDYLIGLTDEKGRVLKSVPSDEESIELLEDIKRNSELRMLLKEARHLNQDDIRKVLDIIRVFKGERL